MASTGTLGEMLSTLLERQPFQRKSAADGSVAASCRALLEAPSEASGRQLAEEILQAIKTLTDEDRDRFYQFLNDDLDIDPDRIAELATAYKVTPTPKVYKALAHAAEPPRQDLFRQLNQAPDATADLVQLRADLLTRLKVKPDLGRTDHDLFHLFQSWFNRGFLVLRHITWESPASILEKIIAYEAVHEIHNWGDLRRRLLPADRKCFAFFHPAMPDDPLIFVEVALTKGVPESIQELLSEGREELRAEEANTAVFYSISNCQAGLAGISFGNSLIKQVVRDLSAEAPNLKRFVTLSPIPGLSRWAEREGITLQTDDPQQIRQLTAHYLLAAKKSDGRPLDPVARFHLANGALVHKVHAGADTSKKGLTQSAGAMVNYLYDLSRISQNIEQFDRKKEVSASGAVRTLAKQAARGARPQPE
ncbi:malonyl-CoA decarboxylase [Shimia isoporae]|uniref:Malonyl-CoA decarboxylase n=1 Tax=Shimia isoporae TaxID=647720 RepID=A0A4R1NJA0_9RHOB|nr:malonyl-CoA decarboxylase [Shimia isoporae]TCL08326.1 malonyl-CoA decarboxylase [Shimia isoporae]